MTLYDGPERRDGAVTEDRVRLMISEAVQQALASHEQHLTRHIDQQFAALRQTFAEAFPAGDPHGHRLAHEQQIANASWWDKIATEAIGKTVTAGVWAMIVFFAISAWEHIKNEVRR